MVLPMRYFCIKGGLSDKIHLPVAIGAQASMTATAKNRPKGPLLYYPKPRGFPGDPSGETMDERETTGAGQ